MKIMTILGTRPEIIRLCRVIPALDAACSHILVHTGQNYDVNLDQIFFDQLGVRRPDHHMGARGSLGEQIGTILQHTEKLIREHRPDRMLLLGDTNSALAAIIAKRLAIPVFHMEAGNRCYDDRVPEEVNRRIIDHSSDILMPYTERSRQNLLREGIASNRIFVTGNPILEVLEHFAGPIDAARSLEKLGLNANGYFVVTMHRAENVDLPDRLAKLLTAFDRIQKHYGLPVVISTHPRTRARLAEARDIPGNPGLLFMDPFPLFDFVKLEKNAFCVLTDSGTVQEECAIFKIPSVTIRDVTERPETIECGGNMLSGCEPDSIVDGVKTVVDLGRDWNPPAEYMASNVTRTVLKIVLGYHLPKAITA